MPVDAESGRRSQCGCTGRLSESRPQRRDRTGCDALRRRSTGACEKRYAAAGLHICCTPVAKASTVDPEGFGGRGSGGAPLRCFLAFVLLCVSCAAHLYGQNALWLDVPFVAQERNGCGAACIAMVTAYWARSGSVLPPERGNADEILRRLYSAEHSGIRARDLESYLRDSGFRTYAFAGDWSDLVRHIAKGRPLIVCTREGGSRSPAHYMIVAGIDPGEGAVLVNDPARGKLTRLDRNRFEAAWASSGRWTLLAVPAAGR